VLRFLRVDRKGELSTPPDYMALVKLLPVLGTLVDGCGEVTLTAEEAERIRSLGFQAESGRWRCPSLPPELTRDNPLLEPMSAGWDGRTSLQAFPKDEDTRETRSANQQVGEARVSCRHPVEAVPEYHKTERPIPQPRTEPDSARIEEAASKIVEALQRAGKPVPKRQLQRRLWRYPATIFNSALRMVERRQHIFLEIR
jgi:hypothetical protein